MRELLNLARADPSAAKQHAMVTFDTLWPDTAHLKNSASLSATLKLLLLLKDRSLSKRALAAFEIAAVNSAQMRSLIKLGIEHGKAFCEQLVAGWIEPQVRRYRYVSLCWIAQLPLSHTTLREGRPQVLQLVKTRQLFKFDKQLRAQTTALLS